MCENVTDRIFYYFFEMYSLKSDSLYRSDLRFTLKKGGRFKIQKEIQTQIIESLILCITVFTDIFSPLPNQKLMSFFKHSLAGIMCTITRKV